VPQKAATASYDSVEAARLGSSAVENALVVIDGNPAWRTDLQSGDEYPTTPMTLGGGTFTWKLVDDDGDLADDLSDTVLLQGIGRVGTKVHVEQVRLQPTETGLTCLEASLHCHGYVEVQGPDIITNQMVSSNDYIWLGGGSSIVGNAEAAGSISNSVSGTRTTGITPRQMPGSDRRRSRCRLMQRGSPIDAHPATDVAGSPSTCFAVVLELHSLSSSIQGEN
jgi:hypothetical protein